MESIKIFINGNEYFVPYKCNPNVLLDILKIKKGKVAIECNKKIVPKNCYDNFVINSGDHIEVVHFVGGG